MNSQQQLSITCFVLTTVAFVLGMGLAWAQQPESKGGAAGNPLLDPKSPQMNKEAPAKYQAKFVTSKGDFTIEVVRAWAPHGADRFYNLVQNGFYDDVRFFRVLTGFMAQFGISGDPKIAAVWSDATIPDDPVKQSNKRGNVTFAKRPGPNTRTTQVFISFADNTFLDGQGFAPFAKVIAGMKVVDSLYAGYGDGPPGGGGPEQGRVQSQGNAYLTRSFPKLDYVKTATIVP
jgi:peptidyl-prolyl cis-trans isomerase A (cyclophilin A)